ncbi:MAG: hypothetical protein KY468_04775 [Armatimonadetes bacterium]|nr:hypothetical protein [Armatimonadota bacterium]
MIDPYTLIGTQAPAPLQRWMFEQSWRSHDYANGIPYPTHAFHGAQWPKNKGPQPTPIPVLANILTSGSNFLFRGGPPAFSVPSEENAKLADADAWLQGMIKANRLGELWHSLAHACGNQGALAAKFSVDMNDAHRPVRICFLDVPQECRVWFDPHDTQRMIFARIQYPYRDPATGDWYYYREEWTDDHYATYEPLRAAGRDEAEFAYALPHYKETLGDGVGWNLRDLEDNPFGLIPITLIRNRRVKGNPLGEGDLWGWFKLVDRLALTLHDSDRWNQKNAEPNVAIVNAKMEDPDPIIPGEPIEVWNEDPKKEADVKLLEASGAAREWVSWYAEKMEKFAWEKAGYSYIDLAQIANKGAWTKLAFEVTYGLTIATTDRKRELWGNSGLCVFFRTILQGLANLGGVPELSGVDEATEVSAEWPPYFSPTDEDRQSVTSRTVEQIQSGVLTLDRGTERIARIEGMPAHEIPTLLKELKAEREAMERDADAAESKPAEAPEDGEKADDAITLSATRGEP